jgi:hypothetical protein
MASAYGVKYLSNNAWHYIEEIKTTPHGAVTVPKMWNNAEVAMREAATINNLGLSGIGRAVVFEVAIRG